MSAELNKSVARKMLEDVHDGKLDSLSEHPGMLPFIPYIKMLVNAVEFTDQDIVQQIADGDWVVTRYLRHVVFKTDFMGTPAGTQSHIETIMMHEIKDGKIMKQYTQFGQAQPSETKYIKTNAADAKLIPADGSQRIPLGPSVEMYYKIQGNEVDDTLDYFEIRVGYLGSPPLHSHPTQYETFHIIEGELTIKVGDELIDAKAGDYVLIPKGAVHGYINRKEGTTARALCNIAPGGFYKFIQELGQYMMTVHPPDPNKINEIAAKHGQIYGGPPLAITMGLVKGQ